MSNDVIIATALIITFISLGFLLPFVQDEFNAEITDNNPQDFALNITDSANVITSDSSILDILTSTDTSFFGILKSMVFMFFWSFSIPAWANLIFLFPLRVAFWFIVIRNIWIGGGG